MLVAGRISALRAFLYIIFQCMGAIAGTLCVRVSKWTYRHSFSYSSAYIFLQILLDEAYYNGLGHTSLAANITELQGVGIEFFLGLVLVLTVFGACDANKPGKKQKENISSAVANVSVFV